MNDSLDEIIARHDAVTACGCSCCDDDYCAYVERQKRRSSDDQAPKDEALPYSAASQRKSLRYVFETLLNKQATARV